jgi:uncharacterized protein (TIGR02246 family)
MKYLVLAVVLMGSLAHGAQAQDAASRTGHDRAKDRAAIHAAIQSYMEAFNAGDAEAVAKLWSPHAEYIDESGQRIQGRDAIQAEFETAFSDGSHPRIELIDPRIRFLSSDVAMEEGHASVFRDDEPPTKTSYLAIHVRKGKVWQLDSVRETVLPSAPSHYDQLKSLEWLIGSWHDQEGSSKVDTTCEWTRNRNFITRSFKVMLQGQDELTGTQIIGWDPASETIRSWMFDSDGGFAHGVWTFTEDHWVIKAVSVLPDGRRASSINIITPVDHDSFTWESVGREVDGELLPNVDRINVVRQ